MSTCIHSLAQMLALRKDKVTPQSIPRKVPVEDSSRTPPRHTPALSAGFLLLDGCHSFNASG